MIKADRIDCALHDRVFSLGIAALQQSWRGVLLTSGTGTLSSDTAEMALESPCLVWSPWSGDHSLRVGAGGVGMQFSITADILANAIGYNAESSEIRMLSERHLVVPIGGDAEAMEDATHAFEVIEREAKRPRAGSTTMIEACVRSVLVLLWRFSAESDDIKGTMARSALVLQHFRHLVEANFRDRWSVGQYAGAIGISSDRLHDICTQKLGRAPKRLVQERVVHEACMMLENSTLSVEQIAGRLGYRDNAHFSRSFKQWTGHPPATYRRHLQDRSAEQPELEITSYANWP